MDDLREKVIKGLEHCKCRSGCNSNCPYSPIMEDHNFGIDECTSHLADDALSMLKAQEEEIKQLKAMNISASDNAFACGVIHGGVTIHQKASEITNIKHIDVFNG